MPTIRTIPDRRFFFYATIFLQGVLVLLGIVVLVLMLWEPQIEGVNAHATNFQIYFKDPFLALAYLGSIPFFIALYQVFKLLRYARLNKIFSKATMKALRTIKYCSLTPAAFALGAEAYFFTTVRGKDDIAGGVAMGLFLIFVSAVIATGAAVFEKRILRRGKIEEFQSWSGDLS